MPWYRLYMTHSDSIDDAFYNEYFYSDRPLPEGEKRQCWEYWVDEKRYENVRGDCLVVDVLPHNEYENLVEETKAKIKDAETLLNVLYMSKISAPCTHQRLKKQKSPVSKCFNGDFETSYSVKCLDCQEHLTYDECLACVKTLYPTANI